MTDKSSDTNLEFPINQELLESATHVREEWRVIRERLNKIDEHRDNVSKTVYERVRKDYAGKLKESEASLMKKKEELDREISVLKKTRDKIKAQHDDHKHRLEEIEFRHKLGEFSDDEFKNSHRSEEEKLTKFETVLAAVENNIARYESVFADESDFHQGDRDEDEEELEEESPSPVSEKDVMEELEEGPDYFSAETDADRTNPAIEESQTAKNPVSKGQARLVIVSGESAGETYPLKGVVSLGRAESNTIVLKDAKVSRQHAQIQQQGTEYIVIDLNSSNGTFVNGQRVEEYVLSDKDEVQIGDFVMNFEAQ